ncbi:hypothetical protein V6N13_027837 [Hibiscus sabdariffa]
MASTTMYAAIPAVAVAAAGMFSFARIWRCRDAVDRKHAGKTKPKWGEDTTASEGGSTVRWAELLRNLGGFLTPYSTCLISRTAVKVGGDASWKLLTAVNNEEKYNLFLLHNSLLEDNTSYKNGEILSY